MEEPLAEITLRKYEKPYQLEKRELVKKICLSIGLLQPGDSRDIIVDILLVLLDAKNSKLTLGSDKIKENVIEIRKKANLSVKGVADSNIRRQLKRLRDIMLVEKTADGYRISDFEGLKKIFTDKIENFYLPSIVERVKEYLDMLEKP
jgi:hypothetical protein